ncbi:MAG: DUF4129 domain-containing protein, partial [Planctomycetes bacterium]|nr:DUF4129 domain-containing protein [Planctomycetota bacterium]
LALLHRANLIRYERTRTNGEYVQQLHERPEVQREFRRLTRLFEMKWYGQRSCQPADYNACREMVEKIRDEVQ